MAHRYAATKRNVTHARAHTHTHTHKHTHTQTHIRARARAHTRTRARTSIPTCHTHTRTGAFHFKPGMKSKKKKRSDRRHTFRRVKTPVSGCRQPLYAPRVLLPHRRHAASHTRISCRPSAYGTRNQGLQLYVDKSVNKTHFPLQKYRPLFESEASSGVGAFHSRCGFE